MRKGLAQSSDLTGQEKVFPSVRDNSHMLFGEKNQQGEQHHCSLQSKLSAHVAVMHRQKLVHAVAGVG